MCVCVPFDWKWGPIMIPSKNIQQRLDWRDEAFSQIGTSLLNCAAFDCCRNHFYWSETVMSKQTAPLLSTAFARLWRGRQELRYPAMWATDRRLWGKISHRLEETQLDSKERDLLSQAPWKHGMVDDERIPRRQFSAGPFSFNWCRTSRSGVLVDSRLDSNDESSDPSQSCFLHDLGTSTN